MPEPKLETRTRSHTLSERLNLDWHLHCCPPSTCPSPYVASVPFKRGSHTHCVMQWSNWCLLCSRELGQRSEDPSSKAPTASRPYGRKPRPDEYSTRPSLLGVDAAMEMLRDR